MAAKKTAKKTTESASPKASAASAPVAKKAVKKAAKKAAPATGKSPAAKAAKPAKPAAPKASTELIARAAYLNYRRRVEQGLPGDSHGDWLEAERQLTKSGGA